jgi:drug/metabolite transporter (DMT)-like permease
MGLGGILIVSYLAIKKRNELKESREFFLPILVFSILAVYLTNVFEFWGLKYVSPAKACFLYSLSPFFSMILSYIHFREKITWQKTLALAIAIGALLPVLLFQSGAEELFRLSNFISLPELSIIAATFCSTYGWIVLRILVKNKSISPLVVNGIGMVLGSIIAFAHSLIFDAWNPIPVHAGNFSSFMSSILLMTIISNLICYNLYSFLLKRLTATFLSFVGLLSPIFTSLSSFLILGEPISWQIIVSTIFMLFAMWLVYRSELTEGYIKDRDLSS